MSRATCGSSSTTRIIARPLRESDADALARVAERCAAECAEDVEGKVEPAGDAGRQRELPRVDRREEHERGQCDVKVRARARPVVAIECEKRQKAPRQQR